MNTQISFKIEEELKNKALLKAKKDGFSLKAIVVAAMRDYVADRYRLGMVFDNDSKNISETDTDYNSKNWKKLIDFTEINKKGVKPEDVLKYLK